MTREGLIMYGENYLQEIEASGSRLTEPHREFLNTAISDMKRVEQLESENKELKDMIEFIKEGIENADEYLDEFFYQREQEHE